MKKLLIILLTTMTFINACSQKMPDNFVFVKGGSFVNTKSNYYNKGITVQDFYIGKYEVTQKEWVDVMGSKPSNFKGDNLPIECVSWYDCIEYCNKRSEKEGLTPIYEIDKINQDPNNLCRYDYIKWTVTADWNANGYRLPTEAEWEYAATGGQLSNNYIYSGSDNVDDVAEYNDNNGESTKPVGGKKPNELGLYDMSGNVYEWCWDWFGYFPADMQDYYKGADGSDFRVIRGGCWDSKTEKWNSLQIGNDRLMTSVDYPINKTKQYGFRVVRNK